MIEKIIAVDVEDKPIKPISKEDAHVNGVLHRAFSVVLVNPQKDILLQQRAYHKYHCGGLWSNACCSHPFWGEMTEKAVSRRLHEELGICELDLEYIGYQLYYYKLDNGLKEFEFDHVFWGMYDGEISICEKEIENVRWEPMEKIAAEVASAPLNFTPWFIQMLPMLQKKMNAY